ncbi:inverse autotransporter beta domain-containing protein [Escherichia albertii]|uniref:inverse autotransporter beta domain-containing protein n=1 Tax=Escherichia albertii TaxID=208962 RepID=UPI000743966D|nr:inverse autotransporter beta domain-containing protein [Escherichia albertii]MCU7291841.1 inverse autotransporter beta domain-containing protein [Escherichia albertii]QTA19181.1 adhesin [Escherichia albertii]HAX3034735.1 intimin-like adhesin FdeC [Escherichia albertii]
MLRLNKTYKQQRFRYSALARCVAWANISVQVLFPLAVTFTPTMAARAHNATLPRLTTENTAVATDNNAEKNIASVAANAGKFLSSQPDSDATRNFVTGMATAKATQEIQEWLGKYGTARVKLNADKDFSLKDSSLEMLYPIYDTPTNMLFTQGAIHRTDDRTQSNIGFGWRHFSGNDWMAGVNTFIDHDLSRSHTRIGIGTEYWRDYLKLSANGYIRASGWKKSPDVEDYQERPANGWDIRAEGYLPAWPQLGASLMYEQYYGDEVGLFGKDKRQKNPHAISAGVNYTPVPLLTLSAEHKQGKSGQNDTHLGLEINYRIGEPLEKQLDTDSIRERRVLTGSRYDLVERNNNIVLEYRKSEVIRIALPERIEGKSGQTVSLGLVVSKATHGLKNVQWEAPSLLAAGGKITGQGNQWQVTLPAYQAGKDNYYAISAVAYDNKGNASKRVQTQVVITGASMSADRSALTLDGQDSIQMLANGSSQKTLALSLRDAEGQPITGMKDQIKTELTFKPAGNIVTRALRSAKSQTQPTLGEFTETEAGVYQSVFTTGTQSGEATITVSIDGMSKTVTADLRATMMDVTKSTLSVSELSDDVAADGQQSYTLTLTAVDTDGNAVTGEASRLRFVPQDNNGVTVGTISEIKPGIYSATVSSTSAGDVVVRVFSEQYQLGALQQTLKFVAGPIDAKHSTITLTSDKPVVGGTLTAIWSAKDANDNPVTGITPEAPSLSGAASTGSSVSDWTDNGDGTWTAQISLGTTAGELIVMPRVNGQNAVAQPLVLNVAGDTSQAVISDMTVKVNNQLANGQSANQITLTVVDTYGNPLQGQNVTLTLPQGVTSKTGNTVTTNAAGKADIELMSTVAGEHNITASVNGAQKTVTVTFSADASSGQVSLQVDDSSQRAANGSDAFTLTAIVKDKNGNALSGELVTFNLPKGVTPAAGKHIWVRTDDEGKAELQVVSVIAGSYEVTASKENEQLSDAKTITFVADKATATISSIEVINNYALANGKDKQTYKITVTDANNNLLKGSEVTLSASASISQGELTLSPDGVATTDEQGLAVFTATTTTAATYTVTATVKQTNGQTSTKTAESKFVVDYKNAVLAVSPENIDSLVADGETTATLEITLMAENNPVGGTMWVEIQAPDNVKEEDYEFLPSKSDHFVNGKITRKFSTTKPGKYTLTFNSLNYGGYEMEPVTITINAVEANDKEAE